FRSLRITTNWNCSSLRVILSLILRANITVYTSWYRDSIDLVLTPRSIGFFSIPIRMSCVVRHYSAIHFGLLNNLLSFRAIIVGVSRHSISPFFTTSLRISEKYSSRPSSFPLRICALYARSCSKANAS
ncbi:hypothetical protein PENTCL1PPCAC_368, partial [Pristionchus entomophagus]